MISFVVLVYRSAENWPELHRRQLAGFGAMPAGFEPIFVKDSGRDQSALTRQLRVSGGNEL
jgi:hypothetical protein